MAKSTRRQTSKPELSPWLEAEYQRGEVLVNKASADVKWLFGQIKAYLPTVLLLVYLGLRIFGVL